MDNQFHFLYKIYTVYNTREMAVQNTSIIIQTVMLHEACLKYIFLSVFLISATTGSYK